MIFIEQTGTANNFDGKLVQYSLSETNLCKSLGIDSSFINYVYCYESVSSNKHTIFKIQNPMASPSPTTHTKVSHTIFHFNTLSITGSVAFLEDSFFLAIYTSNLNQIIFPASKAKLGRLHVDFADFNCV